MVSSTEWRLQNLDVEHCNVSTLLSPGTAEHNFSFPQQPLDLQFDCPLTLSGVNNLVTQPHTPFVDPDAKLYARIEYCASRLSSIPHLFATTGQTMFIHRQMFQALPSTVLQQAMSACALYSMKTPITKPLVHQLLQQNVEHLLTTIDATAATNPDLLVALQSLLLYQLMRLFDGDIRLRAAAEADEATAVLWASELRMRACALSLPLHPVANFADNPKDWQTWLFSESIRRAVVTTFLLRGVYNYLKTGTDSPTVVGVYFTVQKGLWDAQSEGCWAQVKSEKLELQVLVNEWDEVMALAGPDDLEELGVLVMSMLWGLRATKNWLGHQRSVEYGLETST